MKRSKLSESVSWPIPYTEMTYRKRDHKSEFLYDVGYQRHGIVEIDKGFDVARVCPGLNLRTRRFCTHNLPRGLSGDTKTITMPIWRFARRRSISVQAATDLPSGRRATQTGCSAYAALGDKA
jgi:hypothetical protein